MWKRPYPILVDGVQVGSADIGYYGPVFLQQRGY